MKVARINKTITVDPIKMSLFENTKNVHGFNISDFIDEKLEDFLTQTSPDEIQKLHIHKLKAELIEAEQMLPEIEFMMKQRNQQQKIKVEKSKEIDVDPKFFETYEKVKDSLANQVNKKMIDWKYISEYYRFKDKDTAETIIKGKLRDDGLLGCVACKKWNIRTQFCSTYKKNMDSDSSCFNWEKR